MKSFLKSFLYAAKGVVRAVARERNLRFHLCMAVYVLVFSLFYDFSLLQYAIIVLTICGVLALELVNTAIEGIVDMLCPKHSDAAGFIKDVAAAAVLVFCAGAACCGVLLFWDVEVFVKIYRFFSVRPLLLLPLGLSFVASGWFVFAFNKNRKADR